MFNIREVDEEVDEAGSVRVLDLGGYGYVVDVADELLQEVIGCCHGPSSQCPQVLS